MISPDMLALLVVTVGPVVTGASALGGAWLGRRSTLDQAAAAGKVAASTATSAVTADWKAYTERITADFEAQTLSMKINFETYTDSLMDERKLMIERLATVESRAGTAERRLDTAEQRAEVSEARAVKAETAYKTAVRYVRELIYWARGLSQIGEIPEPPLELRDEL